MFKKRSLTIRLLLYLLFFILLSYIHYYIERHDTGRLLISYSVIFSIYICLIRIKHISWKEIMAAAVISRLIFFVGLPNLSDDFYRFIWDGRLLAAGINPFAHIPEYYLGTTKFQGLTEELYRQLNSKNYFTIYPPISQFIFWLSVKLNPTDVIFHSVTIIRLILLSFETGSLFLIYKILGLSKINISRLSIYALNPLVILELTGNLHFEGVMIFFLLLAIYLFYLQKHNFSAIAIALGIGTKLIPLMLLPIFIRKHKGVLKYYIVIGIATLILFFPLLDSSFLSGISSSLSLFFKSFEFNGGLFFLIREIGFYIKGYDIVQTLGPFMSLIALVGILIYSLLFVDRDSSLENAFIVIFFIQLMFATTVHPWYIIPIVALSCSTNFIFPIVWSFLIFFTYSGYSSEGYEHPFVLITIEYLIVIPLALMEIYRSINSQNKSLNRK